MFSLKPLSKDSIAKALVKAKHYRLLEDPWQAESICRDILNVEPENQLALTYLILSITDQFDKKKRTSSAVAIELCDQLTDDYERSYYMGIIQERLGKAALKRDTPRAKYIAYEHYRHAMHRFEEAEKISPEGNEDAVLRWNACVRRIDQFNLEASSDDRHVQPFLDV